jgi:hypothetical protein
VKRGVVRVERKIRAGVRAKFRRRRDVRTATAVSQPGLFVSEEQSAQVGNKCHVVPVGKRRDGGTRYWCLSHKADATAKYGRPAPSCRYSQVAAITPDEMLSLDVGEYRGGVALWGAVAPVYDTTCQPLDRGIHVHARRTVGGDKEIDATFRAVRVTDGTSRVLPDGYLVSELDAIYYMVTSVFGYTMKHVSCPYCGFAHLDKDWFSVHPHRRHLCSGCGRNFRDTEAAIGNPICKINEVLRATERKLKPAKRTLRIRQSDYAAGLQIWGSNPALLWTGDAEEQEGIHVHAFREEGGRAVLGEDETFAAVVIDGVSLDPLMVRTLMAQSALPHIVDRVRAIKCPRCGERNFDAGEQGFTPTAIHSCSKCGKCFPSGGRFRKVIANPLVATLNHLAGYAPRPPQKHSMGLLPETL